MLEIRTLGGLTLRIDGENIKNIGSRKAEALLVYLAVERRQHNRNNIATLFWPESSQDQASKSLRVVLSILRKNLGLYIDISRETVKINSDAQVYLDLSDLEGKLTTNQMEQALNLYQGDFLQGFHIQNSPEFEDWMRFEQECERGLLLCALHDSISWALEGGGDYTKGLTFARRLLELDPLDELAHQQCISLYVLNGQHTFALAQYEKCRVILQEELGVTPSPETEKLYNRILKGERPERPGPSVPVHNLPALQTSFIGRDAELLQIGALIRDPACRLLTLAGLGGSGKTCLALKAAANALRSFPDGTFFVPLETCSSKDYLVPSIANALKFNFDSLVTLVDHKTQLLDYLRNRSILFVMDGFEHLIEGAGLLSEILEKAPNVQILATSRQRLGLKGEWTFHLEGLPYPLHLEEATLDGSDAMRLFVERARQVKTDFKLSEENCEHVARICQLVEGMPLGIELAAACSSLLTSAEIANEMEKGLSFPITLPHNIPEKHRSLQAVFDSIWLLLTDDQQKAFSKLSVFQGGFDHQAAMQVAHVSLLNLSEFMDKSLLKRNEAGHFSMPNLLRQFANEKLSQVEKIQMEVSESHCQYYVKRLAQRESALVGPQMLQTRDEILQDMENLRGAVNWASLHWEAEAIRKVLMTLLCFYTIQGWQEGADVFKNIALLRRKSLLTGDFPDLSKDQVILCARIHQAFFLINLGQIDETEVISRECLQALDELGLREELSECLHNLGVIASFQGDYEYARNGLEEAILLGRECNHILWPSYLLWLGHVYFLLGEYEQGLLSLQKSYELFDRKGTFWGKAFALTKIGLAADGLGKHSQAMEYHRSALEIFDQVTNQAGKGYSVSRMSVSAYFLEQYHQAEEFALEGYQIFEEISHRWGMWISLCRLGFAYIGLNEIEKARDCMKRALQQSRRDQMIPLSLYALAGWACILAQKGEEQAALELFQYVQHHPKNPTPYLEQAAHWFVHHNFALHQREIVTAKMGEDLEGIDELIARFFL